MSQAATLETLLFKATNPSNKLEDVNTIKQFCDLVNKTNGNGNNEGSVTACKILAHKIQSPQVNSFLKISSSKYLLEKFFFICSQT